MDAGQFQHMVNDESGLLGISETSSDMQDLLLHESNDIRAKEAIEVFCYQTKKWIGSYSAALGGLDTLVFCGRHRRERTCNPSGFARVLNFLELKSMKT
jgi:acetate kinase